MEPGKLPLLLCFVAFVVTFLATRAVTRSIRAGRGPLHDVESGGVHVHHAVPGLALLVVGAVVAIGAPPVAPWREAAAVAIGVGASLVLDEFALILRLQDVYWSDEGRVSVEVVALVVACLAGALVGLTPFGVDDVAPAELALRLGGAAATVATMAAVAVCGLKGKYRLALLAVFVPLVAVVGAVRLARPGSRWDAWWYRSPAERGRARERAARFDARWDPRWRRLGDLVAGRPTPDEPAPAPAPVDAGRPERHGGDDVGGGPVREDEPAAPRPHP